MDKKKVLLFSVIITAVLITMPFSTFFVLFILPGLIANQEKKKKRKEMEQQHYEEGL